MSSVLVVAGGPIRQRAWCVERHVQALHQAALHAGVELFYNYVVGESSDGTAGELAKAIQATGRDYGLTWVDNPPGVGHTRDHGNRYSMHYLTQLRQQWVDMSPPDATHLWAVDSDIIVRAPTLRRLIDADGLMVGANVRLSEHNSNVRNVMFEWRGDYTSGEPYRTGREHYFVGHNDTVRASWVGACVLYRRSVFDENGFDCRYDEPSVLTQPSIRMEELGILRKLRVRGVVPWWCPDARTNHLMTVPGE